MNRYYYDLHIHSCLSPCSDNDMTPHNIAGMATLCGLQIVALTDHNSVKNCRPFYQACRKHGLIAIAGMELTTAEDIHLVCLFETLERAEEFESAVAERRILYRNKKEIFGDQLVMNDEDEVVCEEEYLLINATTLSLEEATSLARDYGAVAFPAHIDRESNGILAILGEFPEEPRFSCVELHDAESTESYKERYNLSDKKILVSSDAHHLWDLREVNAYVELDDEPYSSELVRRRFFEYLKS